MAVKKKVSRINIKLIVLLIGILIAAGLLIHFKTQINSPIPEAVNTEEVSVLMGLSNFLKTNGEPREYQYSNWIDSNGTSVPLEGQLLDLGTNGTNGVGKYGNFTTDDLAQVNEEFLSELQGKISTYFINEGFSLNEPNTNLIPGEYYFSIIGFEKGNLKCISSVAKQSDPFGYISCGTVNNEQIKLQKELSNVYDEQKADYQNKQIVFRVDKMMNDFASGSTSYLSGNQWIAKKISGVWQTIWAGQDFPLCSDMEKYEVPSSFYPGCYNAETQKEQRTY